MSRPTPQQGTAYGLARGYLRVVSVLVPGERRNEWCEDWESELWHLGHRLELEGVPRLARLRTLGGFALGALPHGMSVRGEEWTMEVVFGELRAAIRGLARSPIFTAVVAGTLALGVGANAAIFTLVNGLLLRPPAELHEPQRLVQIARGNQSRDIFDNFSHPNYLDIRRGATAFEDVAGWAAARVTLGSGPSAEVVPVQVLTGNYFRLVGLSPARGRLLAPEDDRVEGAHPVAVVSYQAWQTRFGGDESILGRRIEVNGTPFEVVGVAPRGFGGIGAIRRPPTLFLPVAMQPVVYRSESGLLAHRGYSFLWAVGRLSEGTTFDEAQASMAGITAGLREQEWVEDGLTVLLSPGVGLTPEEREEVGLYAVALFAIVGLVLLVTCANVANLLLARGSTRVGETGVRLALGASRGRLLRQFTLESLVLGALGGAVAIPVAYVAADTLPGLLPEATSVSFTPDARVLGFTLAIGLVAGLLFGIVPALRHTRTYVSDSLRAGRGDSGESQRLRKALIIGQLALSMALVSGAGLLIRSLNEASGADPGFDSRQVLAATVNLDDQGRFTTEQGRAFFNRLRTAVFELPGVEAVGLTSALPIASTQSRQGILRLGATAGAEAARIQPDYLIVSPGYFTSLGMPLVAGRDFGPEDEGESAGRGVIVNETLARVLSQEGRALGMPVFRGAEEEDPPRVVGIIRDARLRSLRTPARPAIYYPISQVYSGRMNLTVRTSGPPSGMTVRVGEIFLDVDPELPVFRVGPLHPRVAGSLSETRTLALMVSTFGGLALLLSAMGLYGVISFSVTQRVREMGVRIAIGAEPGQVVGLIVRGGLKLAAIGVGLGVLASFGISKVLKGALFGVSAGDPMTLGVSTLVLAVVAIIATYLPARRATQIDPTEALRTE